MAKSYAKTIEVEGKKLRAKIYALDGFIKSEKSSTILSRKRNLINKQIKVMREYNSILDERLALEV